MKVLIAVPALNEAGVIARTVQALRRQADAALSGHDVRIVVADNGSTDGTAGIVDSLRLPGVSVLRLAERGKGRAIRAAWKSEAADAYAFMDADLAVDLAALAPLVDGLRGADVCVGSRYHRDSRVERSLLRRAFSSGYRSFVRGELETAVSDLPCGFKAVSARVVRDVLPQVRDDGWFFDTELTVLAERAGLTVAEIPVRWREPRAEGRASKVRPFALAREYYRKVTSLRDRLGLRRAAHDPLRALLAGIGADERRAVLAVATVIAALGLVAPFAALHWAGEHGMRWNGRQFFAPGDTAAYLSYVAQARDGALSLRNDATLEPLVPVVNWFWQSVGYFARVLWLEPLAAYHVVRTLLIFPLFGVAYAWTAAAFRGARARIAALALFAFGGGMGVLASPLLNAFGGPRHVGASYEWPIDFWVAEANAFSSALYSPHFVASWALLLFSLLLLFLAYRDELPRYGAWAGLAALALFQFHPFHAPTLWAVGAVVLAAQALADGFRSRRALAFAWFVAASSPAVAYHWWLIRFTGNGRFMLDTNVLPTPAPWHVALGLGATLALAAYGWRAERAGTARLMRPSARQFLAAWAVTQLALLYAPISFQRRLVEGVQLPLALLSVPAAAVLLRRRWPPAAAGIVAAAALGMSTFSVVDRGLQAAANEPKPIFMFTRDEAAALDWLRANTPRRSRVLTSPSLGNDVMGWAERPTFVGHWANTIDAPGKAAVFARFLSVMTDAERRAFVTEHGIRFVLLGPSDVSYASRLRADWLWQRFASGGYVIFEVLP